MLIRLYSIFDRVARVYADPFVSINDATAARAFTLAQSSPDSMLRHLTGLAVTNLVRLSLREITG